MIVGKIMNVTQKSSPVAIAAANAYNSCPTARPGGHGMNFCKNCKELHVYGVDQRGSCPWHAYLTPDCVTGGARAVPDSTVANLSSAQFNHFDTKSDEECEYFFRKKIADMC